MTHETRNDDARRLGYRAARVGSERDAELVALLSEAGRDEYEQGYQDGAREYRMTTGDTSFGRSDEELAAMAAADADWYEAIRRSAGVCDEFPAGEFAVPGFNSDLRGSYDDER